MQPAAWLGCAAAAIWLGFDMSGLDAAISRPFFDPATGTFPLRDNWWLAAPGHTGLKRLAFVSWCATVLGAACLPANWRHWQPVLREAAASMALAALLVLWLRGMSAHSCPWDIDGFGAAARHFPLFTALPADPGPGKCLPAAHASSGFAAFGLYFALREHHPGAARVALVAAWTLGLAAGAAQVARGAHFASHALWTAWICWTATAALHAMLARWRAAR